MNNETIEKIRGSGSFAALYCNTWVSENRVAMRQNRQIYNGTLRHHVPDNPSPCSHIVTTNAACPYLHYTYKFHVADGRRWLVRRFCVTLLFILCPQALSSNMFSISFWLTPLLALFLAAAPSSVLKPGLPGGERPAAPAFSSPAAKCQSG